VNPVHRRLLKEFSLGDKEGERLLVALYNDTPEDQRESLLLQMGRESDKVRKKLYDLEMTKLEETEAQIAQIVDAAEDAREERLHRESPGGDDEEAREGGEAE
jgi:lipase chaperone LimK